MEMNRFGLAVTPLFLQLSIMICKNTLEPCCITLSNPLLWDVDIYQEKGLTEEEHLLKNKHDFRLKATRRNL